MPVQALIFDVDGTLAETEEAHRIAFNQSFRDAGLDWSWDRALYRKLLSVTGGKERIRYFLSLFHPKRLEEADIADTIKALHEAKTVHYTQAIATGAVPLRPGIEALIQAGRKAGLPLAISTTTSLPNVVALVEATLGPDAMSWFAAIGAGDQVKAKKPAPDVYLHVLDVLGLDAQNCVAFEDSINGLKSALAANIPTLICPSAYTDGEDFTGAKMVVTEWDTLTLADLG